MCDAQSFLYHARSIGTTQGAALDASTRTKVSIKSRLPVTRAPALVRDDLNAKNVVAHTVVKRDREEIKSERAKRLIDGNADIRVPRSISLVRRNSI